VNNYLIFINKVINKELLTRRDVKVKLEVKKICTKKALSKVDNAFQNHKKETVLL